MVAGNIYDQIVDPNYRQINLEGSTHIIFANDLHGDTDALEKILEEAPENAVVDIRDISNHNSRMKFYEELGLEDSQKIILDYLSTNLSEEEMGAFQVGNYVEQLGGMDKYVEAVKAQNPSVNEAQLKAQVKPLYEIFKTEEFGAKLEDLINNRPEDITEKLEENQAKLQIANYLMDSAEVNAIKKVVGDNEKNLSFIVGGNHEDVQFYKLVEQAIGGNVYYADAVEKVSKIGSGKNQISFLTPDNVTNLIPGSQMMVYGNNISQLYPGLTNTEGIVQDLTREQLESMSVDELKKRSPYFRKIVGDGEVPSIDVIAAHFRPGTVEGSPYPDITDPGIAFFAKDTPVVSGHIHTYDTGKTNLCDNFEQGAVFSITKVDGELKTEKLSIDFDSNGQIDYLTLGGYSTIEDMKKAVDDLYEEQKSAVAGKIGPKEDKEQKKQAA